MAVARQVGTVAKHVTLKQAALEKGVTPNAVFLWMKYNDVPRIKIGNTILVSIDDLVKYNPKAKAVK